MNNHPEDKILSALELSDDDIYEAMKEIPGYIDITPQDFKEIYKHAFKQAITRIARSIKAVDIMTRRVLTVKRETPLQEVAEVMAMSGVAGVPVINDNKRVIGVISEKDFLKSMGIKERINLMSVIAECLKGKGCVVVTIKGKTAKDIMTSPPVTIVEETTLMEIVDILNKKGINRLPVVDRDGYLIGIVSRADIIKAPFIKNRL